MYLFFCDTLLEEVFIGRPLGSKKILRNSVCQYPIDLFRHTSIKTSQARFHMSNGNLQLHCCKSTAKCRIDIADYQYQIRFFFHEDWFEFLHDFCSLDCMRARSDL